MKTWGRINGEHGVPFSRTTAFVEAHWSTLEKRFLKHFNWPRPDFLLFLIDRRLIPKFTSAYSLLVTGGIKPRWFKSFVKDWKRCSESGYANERHRTDCSLWLHHCPSFLSSHFYFCKHFVQGFQPPPSRNSILNRNLPRLRSGRDDGRKYPIVEWLECETGNLPQSAVSLLVEKYGNLFSEMQSIESPGEKKAHFKSFQIYLCGSWDTLFVPRNSVLPKNLRMYMMWLRNNWGFTEITLKKIGDEFVSENTRQPWRSLSTIPNFMRSRHWMAWVTNVILIKVRFQHTAFLSVAKW